MIDSREIRDQVQFKYDKSAERNSSDIFCHKTTKIFQYITSKVMEEPNKPCMNETLFRTLKVQLMHSLRNIELFKQNVTEKITAANDENKFHLLPDKLKENDLKATNNSTFSCQQDLSANKMKLPQLPMNYEGGKIKSNQTNTDNKKVDLIVNDYGNPVDKNESLINISTNKSPEIGSEKSILNSRKHENVMISLISDDDSNSESEIISITCGKFESKITDSNNVQDQSLCIKLEDIKSDNLVSNEMTGTGSIEESSVKIQKRKLDENEKQPNKKRKKSREKNETSFDKTSKCNLFGEFYKVKLTNLPANISYVDVVDLLRNSGLEYLDILLINNGDRSFAEVSFSDVGLKEKAISLDRTLLQEGMKVRIKPI